MESDPLIGEKLGGYRIVEKIGQGGMADIYKGYQPQTGRYVAIKLIGHHLPADPALTKRFRREAQAAASLQHPHIITVYDFGEYSGGHYMVMEYIEGTNLQRRIKYRFSRKRGFQPREIVTLIGQIASALDFAHQKGVVHRDVKPANILLSKKGRVILTDFGLVMLRDRVSQQTRGESFGTPEYIAPEQAIDSRAATHRSDIYSLGVILYELTTGHIPFDAESALSMALMHIGEEPTPPRKHVSEMPVAVEAVILRAMAKEPERRYASAGELAAALRDAYGDQLSAPSRARRRPKKRKLALPTRRGFLAAGGVILLLLLGVGLFLLTREGGDWPAVVSSALTPTDTLTPTSTAAPTGTAESTDTATPTGMATPTSTGASRDTATPTGTARPTSTTAPTDTAKPTNTAAPTSTPTPIDTATATNTAAPTDTATPPSTAAPTDTAVPTDTASPTQTPLPEGTPTPIPDLSPGAQTLRPIDQMTMHFVPGGPFLMGSTQDDPDARPHERPQHQVTLSPFWLDQTEVTNAQYRLCVEAGACSPPKLGTFFDDPAYADHPVVYVTWGQAATYCAWLATGTGWPMALPTEAQWEKAAAWDPESGHQRRYPWGDQSPTAELANLNISGLRQTAPVGSYPDGASFYGLLDLAGNVWEWVADWYDQDYYATPDLPPDPTGPSSGSQHVMRGGNYGFGTVEARAAHRTAGGPEANGIGLGFRCAVNAEKLP